MIIRDERVTEIATLTPSRTLHFIEPLLSPPSFIEEECSKAFQKGLERGEALGYAKAMEENKSLVGLLQAVSHKLLEHKQRLLDQLKPEVVEFAITICEKVIRKELRHPEVFVKLIHSLLTYASSKVRNETVILFLAPDDLVMLETFLGQSHFDKQEIGNVAFRIDPLMRRGDCRIEIPTELLNYTISRELDDLQSKVLQG